MGNFLKISVGKEEQEKKWKYEESWVDQNVIYEQKFMKNATF